MMVTIRSNFCCRFVRAYERMYFGDTAEERLLDMNRRAKIGPAEGEPGLTRVESSSSNGVQVRGTVTFWHGTVALWHDRKHGGSWGCWRLRGWLLFPSWLPKLQNEVPQPPYFCLDCES